MSEANTITLKTYDECFLDYINKTPPVSDYIFDWIDSLVVDLPKYVKIFEIGSGPGREADYFEGLGYVVERSDASISFVNYLKENGHLASIFDVLVDEFPDKYDLIYSHAVFLHFESDEFEYAVSKCYSNLNSGGTFSFSVKEGEGEKWELNRIGGPRYYQHWKPTQLKKILEKQGFVNIKISDPMSSAGHEGGGLLIVIATKP